MSSEKLPQYPSEPVPAQGGVQLEGHSPSQGVSQVAQNYRDQLFAQCAMGNHELKTELGMCGIITAIMLFPCGLICLLLDKKESCSRCGVSLGKKKYFSGSASSPVNRSAI